MIPSVISSPVPIANEQAARDKAKAQSQQAAQSSSSSQGQSSTNATSSSAVCSAPADSTHAETMGTVNPDPWLQPNPSSFPVISTSTSTSTSAPTTNSFTPSRFLSPEQQFQYPTYSDQQQQIQDMVYPSQPQSHYHHQPQTTHQQHQHQHVEQDIFLDPQRTYLYTPIPRDGSNSQPPPALPPLPDFRPHDNTRRSNTD